MSIVSIHLQSQNFGCLYIPAGAPFRKSQNVDRCPSRWHHLQGEKLSSRKSQKSGSAFCSLQKDDQVNSVSENRIKKSERVGAAILGIQKSVIALKEDFLSKIPSDLQVEVKDAAFYLTSGPLKNELGDQLATVISQIGSFLEASDGASLKAAIASLPAAVAELKENSNEEFYLGKRLIAASRPLISSGSKDLIDIGRKFKLAGESLQTGIKEVTNEESEVEASRLLKFGDLQVELTKSKALIGSGIALVVGVFCVTLANNLLSIDSDSPALVATSLRGSLLFAFYGSALLSVFSSIALLILGLGVDSPSK